MPAPPADPSPVSLTAVVLAGGLGRRMSGDGRGVNKALVSWRQRPLIAHVIERLAPQVGHLMINANADLERFAGFGVPVVPDRLPDHPGPLAGLQAAMTEAQSLFILTVPCDAPNLPTDLARRLWQSATESGVPVTVASTGGRAQPVFLLAARSLLPSLTAYLAGGGRSVEGWYRTLPHRLVNFDDTSQFANINTEQDLAELDHPTPRLA